MRKLRETDKTATVQKRKTKIGKSEKDVGGAEGLEGGTSD